MASTRYPKVCFASTTTFEVCFENNSCSTKMKCAFKLCKIKVASVVNSKIMVWNKFYASLCPPWKPPPPNPDNCCHPHLTASTPKFLRNLYVFTFDGIKFIKRVSITLMKPWLRSQSVLDINATKQKKMISYLENYFCWWQHLMYGDTRKVWQLWSCFPSSMSFLNIFRWTPPPLLLVISIRVCRTNSNLTYK